MAVNGSQIRWLGESRHGAERSHEDREKVGGSRHAARLARVLAWLVAAGIAGGCRPNADSGGERLPNVLLVTIESTRADHVGAYGYGRETTPVLDALADEGTLYEQAYAVTSWTLPSHASLMTGLYPAAHRVVGYDDRLDDSQTTLAELLRDAGYQTAAFVSGPFLHSQHNLSQGFEVYDQSSLNPGGNQAAHGDVTSPTVERRVEGFLRDGRDAERPFFVFVYLWDPHYDYIPPPPFDTRFVPALAEPVDLRGYETRGVVTRESTPEQLEYVVSQYDGEIAAADALLGRLFDALRELSEWESTMVVVTADHGEEFFEHGTKGHRNNLYEESIHVPLIVKLPGAHGPSREPRAASLIDLYPTILEVAGVTEMPYHHGRSLLEAEGGDSRPLFFELMTEWIAEDPATGESGIVSDLWLAVRDGDQKLVLSRNDGRLELFDVTRDPTEQMPLGPGYRPRIDELGDRIERHLQAMRQDAERWERSPPVTLSPGDEERLRSLGYLGPAGTED